MDIDLTIIVQLALLAVLVGILRPLVFVPLLAVIDSRDQKIHGTRAEVARLEQLAAADREAYQERMQEARRQGLHERERLRQAGRDEAQRILNLARSRAAQTLMEARGKVAQEAQRARAQLDQEVGEMAQAVVARLLAEGEADAGAGAGPGAS